jgi:23S rRNA (cytidine2498-2'-O)-methyltransferase
MSTKPNIDSAQLKAPGAAQPSSWLIRIPEVFAAWAGDILPRLGAASFTRLGREFYLIKTDRPDAVRHSDAGVFVGWNIPVEHSWPCCPQEMDGFIERAARAMWRKFGPRTPQAILIGQLDPGAPNKFYRSLASNLRGRTLQLFPPLRAREVEEQDPVAGTLFCLVGSEGLFCGVQSPKESNGFYPGGTKFIAHGAAKSISRAGAKIAEALHYLLLYRPALPRGSHWLELGASPGGMTSELLAREFRVTAVDRAPLDRRLDRQPGLTFVREAAESFQPNKGTSYDALLSDLNGEARDSMRLVIRLSTYLIRGGLVVFTLKTRAVATDSAVLALLQDVVAAAAGARMKLIAKTHLTYNRQEFTLFFERQ